MTVAGLTVTVVCVATGSQQELHQPAPDAHGRGVHFFIVVDEAELARAHFGNSERPMVRIGS
jgi:hypothetical protein